MVNGLMKITKKLALFACIPLLFACGPAPDESQPVVETEPVRIAGQAFYPERIMMPAGSWLDIEVIDEDRERVVASERLDDIGAPPYSFDIEIEPGQWRADRHYLLSLTVYMPDGSPRFSADVGLDAPDFELEPIRLSAVEFDEDIEIDPQRWYGYRCGDVAVDVRFAGPELAILSLPWALVEVDAVEAASGARYQRGEHEFWAKGTDQAMLKLPEADTLECRASRHLSPWTRATERGVIFRAFGNEPGWVVELTDQPEPIIHLTLDYGTRELVLEDVEILPDQAGVIAQSPGNQARIDFIDEPCHDTMIGWTLPITVRMQLNEQTLNACGRFLE